MNKEEHKDNSKISINNNNNSKQKSSLNTKDNIHPLNVHNKNIYHNRSSNHSNKYTSKYYKNMEKEKLIEKVVYINRVAKVVKGGRRFSFAALVIVGNNKGSVGVGYGKAKEVPSAISKSIEEAKKSLFIIPMVNDTIPHRVQGESAAGVILLIPACAGTGVIAGGPIRAVLECAGIKNVLSKSLGSSNSLNMVYATINALKLLESPSLIASRKKI